MCIWYIKCRWREPPPHHCGCAPRTNFEFCPLPLLWPQSGSHFLSAVAIFSCWNQFSSSDWGSRPKNPGVPWPTSPVVHAHVCATVRVQKINMAVCMTFQSLAAYQTLSVLAVSGTSPPRRSSTRGGSGPGRDCAPTLIITEQCFEIASCVGDTACKKNCWTRDTVGVISQWWTVTSWVTRWNSWYNQQSFTGIFNWAAG